MIALIGGSGASSADILGNLIATSVETPWSDIPVQVFKAQNENSGLLFLPRHGVGHKVPPHKINYRANLWALKQSGADRIVALNAVGSMDTGHQPGDLAIPVQVIDYTWGREHTFYDGADGVVEHVDFTHPYDDELSSSLIKAARSIGQRIHENCTYAATQGPRLESAAEILRLEHDGANLVGMTGMPEAGLARELEIPYASLCIVANLSAGKGDGELSLDEIFKALEEGVSNAVAVFEAMLGKA